MATECMLMSENEASDKALPTGERTDIVSLLAMATCESGDHHLHLHTKKSSCRRPQRHGTGVMIRL